MNVPMLDRELISRIKKAFRNVRLDDGIGLHQARSIDDCGSDSEQRRARRGDQKHDWGQIAPDELNRYFSSLYFMDSKGVRFHLPAFIINELSGLQTNGELMSLLTKVGDEHGNDRFSALSIQQREVIAEYMSKSLEQEYYAAWWEDIKTALDQYWRSAQ